MVFVERMMVLKNVIAVDKIFNLLLNKYESLLMDVQIGYNLDPCKIAELTHLLHILHFVSFGPSKETLKILAYYE